jgi:tRNA (cmo5U34)-methyltransferase
MMGATTESLANLSMQLREKLSVISLAETGKLLKQSDIPLLVRFFQAFMISGWHGKKCQA